MRASISARLIPAVSTRNGRSMRRPSANRPSTRVITMVASLAGENAYWDSGPTGQTSSLIRSEPLSSNPMPSRLAAIRHAYDARLMPRTRSPTGRLQHNPDRSYGGSVQRAISCSASAKSALAIDSSRQPLGRPVEVAYRHVKGVSVGHAGHISHCRSDGGVGLRLQVELIWHRIRVLAVVLHQPAQHVDDGARLSQRSGSHVNPFVVECPQCRKSLSFCWRHADFAVLLDRLYDR